MKKPNREKILVHQLRRRKKDEEEVEKVIKRKALLLYINEESPRTHTAESSAQYVQFFKLRLHRSRMHLQDGVFISLSRLLAWFIYAPFQRVLRDMLAYAKSSATRMQISDICADTRCLLYIFYDCVRKKFANSRRFYVNVEREG